MCDKAVLENVGKLESTSDCNKIKQTCDKAVLENSGTLDSVPNCYKN